MSEEIRTKDQKVECTPCGECSMLVFPGEYHPFAACLMFKQCHDSEVVARNLEAVLEHGRMGVKKRLNLTRETRRKSRCPHGVHELNRCERCD